MGENKVAADVYGCLHYDEGCPAKLWVSGGTSEYLMESTASHDHAADPVDIGRRQTVEKAVDLMNSRPERRVRDVMSDALRDVSPAVMEAVDHENLRKQLGRIKSKLRGHPTGPTTPEELEIPADYQKHPGGETFIIFDATYPSLLEADGVEYVDRIIVATHPTMAKVFTIRKSRCQGSNGRCCRFRCSAKLMSVRLMELSTSDQSL